MSAQKRRRVKCWVIWGSGRKAGRVMDLILSQPRKWEADLYEPAWIVAFGAVRPRASRKKKGAKKA